MFVAWLDNCLVMLGDRCSDYYFYITKGRQKDILEELRSVVDLLEIQRQDNKVNSSGYAGKGFKVSPYPWNKPRPLQDKVIQVDGETLDAQDDLFDTMVDRMEAYPKAMWPILDKGIRIALNSISDNDLLITNDRAHVLNPSGFNHLDLVSNWGDYINDDLT